MDCLGRADDGSLPPGGPSFDIPDSLPITAAQTEIHLVIGDRFVLLVAGVERDDLFKLFGLVWAKEEVCGALIGLERVEPALAERVVSADKKSVAKAIVEIARVHGLCDSELAKTVDATGRLGLFFCFRQGRQKHAGQDGNNGDDHQEFDEGEPAPTMALSEWVGGLHGLYWN